MTAGILPPTPRDGRDYDPDVLQQAVNDAVANIPVPADGKSITPDDVRPMLEQMVKLVLRHRTGRAVQCHGLR